MKLIKIALIVVGIYACVVALFESWLGYSQPTNQRSIAITTTDADGEQATRILSRVDHNGVLYVSANHWPRQWYKDALARPEVTVEFAGEAGNSAKNFCRDSSASAWASWA